MPCLYTYIGLHAFFLPVFYASVTINHFLLISADLSLFLEDLEKEKRQLQNLFSTGQKDVGPTHSQRDSTERREQQIDRFQEGYRQYIKVLFFSNPSHLRDPNVYFIYCV